MKGHEALAVRLGPFPAWAWAGIVGGAFLARRWIFPASTSETAATPTQPTISDTTQFPNGTSPFTWDARTKGPLPIRIVVSPNSGGAVGTQTDISSIPDPDMPDLDVERDPRGYGFETLFPQVTGSYFYGPYGQTGL